MNQNTVKNILFIKYLLNYLKKLQVMKSIFVFLYEYGKHRKNKNRMYYFFVSNLMTNIISGKWGSHPSRSKKSVFNDILLSSWLFSFFLHGHVSSYMI